MGQISESIGEMVVIFLIILTFAIFLGISAGVAVKVYGLILAL